MSLLTFMQELQEVEAAITLPSSVRTLLSLQRLTEVRKAHVVYPASNQSLTTFPCFINAPDEMQSDLRLGNFTDLSMSVQVDFYGGKVFDEKTQKIVLAFWDATLAAFRAQQPYNRRFGGSCDHVMVRAERPMVATMEWNGVGYPGFRMYLDVEILGTVVPV